MKKFSNEYNAYFVIDKNNWMDVPKNTQFIIFEEVGPTKKLDLLELKAITGGSATGFGGNCKTHRESF